MPPAPSRPHRQRPGLAAAPVRRTSRPVWIALAVAWVLFVVYGSLVPFHYQARPWQEAVSSFAAELHAPLDYDSRTDWAVNVLLFVPLGLFWSAAWGARGTAARIAAGVAVFAAGVLLSVGVEFAQSFFPGRNPSVDDVVAESAGGALGVALWWAVGRRLQAWLDAWSRSHTVPSLSRLALYGYLFAVFAYGVLPLDLTISPVEVYHKWRWGRVLLWPLPPLPHGDLVQWAYDLLMDVLLWVPAALLWVLSGLAGGAVAVARVTACAALLEFLQLFVWSRITDVSDVTTAFAGALIGVALASRWKRAPAAAAPGGNDLAPCLLAVAASLALLALVFWFPFDFRTDGAFVRPRLAGLRRMPLEVLFYGSEIRAVTEMLHKTLFFAPLGASLAWTAQRLQRRSPQWPGALLHAAAVVLVAAAAATIEGGQLLLPNRLADFTDWMLETLGGVVAYAIGRRIFTRLRAGAQAPARE